MSADSPHRLACLLGAPALAAALLAAGPALAETSPWYLGLAQTVTHENNLYRVGEGQVLPADASRSDTVATTALVGGIDQAIGRQRVHGSVNLGSSRYQNNSRLNSPNLSTSLALDWATVGDLAGTLSYSGTKSLIKFNSINTSGALETQRNLVGNQAIDALVRLGQVGKLSAEAALGHRRVSYSAPAYQFREYRQNTASIGLRYRPSGLLTLGTALRQTDTRYPYFRQVAVEQFEADRSKRQDLDFTANWQPSQVSSVSGRLSATRNRYDQDTQRDSSGLTGSVNWRWQPGGKTTLNTTAGRDMGQSADVVNFGIFGSGVIDYSRTTTYLRLRADHALSAKVSLNASAQQNHRALTDSLAVASNTPIVSSGSDRTRTLSLGARWTPTRSALLGCDLSHEKRSTGSTLSSNMGAATFGCFGQIVIQ